LLKKQINSRLFTGIAHADKYQSENWIARKMVNVFMTDIILTANEAGSAEVHEIGCGEGHILGLLAGAGFVVRGCDISTDSLAVAKSEAAKRKLEIPLSVKSIYELEPTVDSSDTVICCEVLEHLTDPATGMEKLVSITRKDLIVSVPNEPLWHVLNMMRGKYLTALGNTPGHFQHWSSKQFISFVDQYAEIISVKTPLPWTLIHCRPRK
jgi:2-polyprenyl-3-methyl-5-hydroxy-6-metoxy-1,4-benzoquinol methylase